MPLARRALQVFAFICTLIVGVTSMAVIVTQTAWFKEWLRALIVSQSAEFVNGRLTIGRLEGNLFYGVELADVGVTMNGETVVDIAKVALVYNPFTFLSGDVVLDDIRLSRPVLRLERTADGWNLAHLIKARTPDPDEPQNRRAIEIGEIAVSDGTLYFDSGAVGTTGVVVPSRIDGVDATLGVKSNKDDLTVDIARVSMRSVEPSFDLQTISGVIRRTRDMVTLEDVSIRTTESSMRVAGTIAGIEGSSPIVDIRASSDKVGLEEIARIVPALRGYVMHPGFEVTATGPAERLSVDVSFRDDRLGRLAGDLIVDAREPQRRVAGRVTLEHFDLGPLVPARDDGRSTPSRRPRVSSDITGEARIDLALPSGRLPLSGTYAVNARHVQVAGYEARNVVANGRIDGSTIRLDASAAAYGGRATAAGTIRTGQAVALDLRGRASQVDLRNLPSSLRVPEVPSDLRLEYELTGRGSQFSGNVKLDASTLAGASIAPGTTGSFSVGQGAPQYAAKGSVTDLDLQQIGNGFDIKVLSADRYRSRVNTSFDMTGSGGGRYPLTIDATGTVVDSEMFGASFPRMDFTVALAGGDARIETAGGFANLDPAVVSGNERVAGVLGGTVDVVTTLRGYETGVTVDSIDLTGRVSLGPSTLGEIAIDTAMVEGDYARREGNLTKLAITGADVNVQAQGPVSLSESGSTNLTLHIDSGSLEGVGKIVGQPLKGSAVVDATVTGNARRLEAQGALKGTDIGVGENKALSLATDFVAAIPDLTPGDVTVTAKNMVTFLELGGQKITELAADVTYAQSKLEFKATAQEGVRQLEAGGDVIFHPDHQEIHLPRLVLRSEQIEWRSAPGSEAAVQYAKDRVAIENVQLVNADQRITVNGVLGSSQEPLQVRLENVDVAQVDRLLLGEERLAGRLNADATITGALNEPRVEGQFTLSDGAFRTFRYQSLTGKVDYAGMGLNLDVRLEQTPAVWLAVKGYAPLTLFRPTPADLEGSHQPAAPGEAVALNVSSSQIDLGLIQGFTSVVTNVTGALQANLEVTGSGYDPHLAGVVEIRGGTFAVPALGTSYSGLDTRIDLNAEGISIQEFKIVDARGFPLTVGGTLALHARSVGAVDVKLESQKFEVVDNTLADLKLNTDIRITGEVRKPRIEGFIEVENGTVHVARLVERVTADAYATNATELPGAETSTKPQAGDQPPVPAGEPSLFDALDVNIGLSVPSNLVLRGTNIRAANAPVAIGDMSVTVGGVLQIRKAPSERLRLVGEVNTVRGTYTFQGRRFDIMRDGQIGFSGSDELDPLLNLQARRIISGVETFIYVRGTMKAPEISFGSNPPLQEADILALIVFNQPINELGEGQQASIAEQAGALAGGFLTAGLARSIGDVLELDEFEIEAQGEGGTGPSLTVGEQVGRSLFFRLRQAFGAEQTTELILEYQIRDFLRLQGSLAEGDSTAQHVQFRRVERGGLDLIFFFSY